MRRTNVKFDYCMKEVVVSKLCANEGVTQDALGTVIDGPCAVE